VIRSVKGDLDPECIKSHPSLAVAEPGQPLVDTSTPALQLFQPLLGCFPVRSSGYDNLSLGFEPAPLTGEHFEFPDNRRGCVLIAEES
jgi:hypothetical protein